MKPQNNLGAATIRLLLGAAVGVACGTAAALFLHVLTSVTAVREGHPWLLWLLPVGGACMSWIYMRWGRQAAQGNPLLFASIRGGEGDIPLRMGPMALLGTWMTHLLGGSAGREGTALQLGGSLAAWIGRLLRVPPTESRLLLLCGISGGFGAVFGTPVAGAVFAFEVAGFRVLTPLRLLSALTASFVGHVTALAWGASHTHYSIGPVPFADLGLLLRVALAAVAFGLLARLFVRLLASLRALLIRHVPQIVWRSVIGGLLVIGLTYVCGSRDYLGLSLPLLSSSFDAQAEGDAFVWKLLFTVVTLGSGYPGGEVTPLFVIGAAFGSFLAGMLSAPPALLAGVGMVSIFAGAARAPLACFALGIELFGGGGALYLLVSCVLSALLAGSSGLYHRSVPSSALRRIGQTIQRLK
ncbi:hypothetical protein PA598K_02532 [Paenibacillus sp. 598K]|uniref:chloride channel protein n=1 Tax=Paenibacillus sp. 598K TaxID=1117987 RepID=UPI000FFAFAE6|nr:chloride channel protein [Paenibacillus sp. 598K]GBF74200.1 hypothetical protein PA598K_02532 [Paenibacillus sp. 598K]